MEKWDKKEICDKIDKILIIQQYRFWIKGVEDEDIFGEITAKEEEKIYQEALRHYLGAEGGRAISCNDGSEVLVNIFGAVIRIQSGMIRRLMAEAKEE